VDVGGSGESGKRTYRRADLIRLKMTDPDRYEALSHGNHASVCMKVG